MAPVPASELAKGPVFYMPHHPVLRETSSTSPLRVVFNASCNTNSGTFLNNQLLVGPKLQEDLSSIPLRWRTHRLVFIADIVKILLIVTYGTASAPYLAMRVLKQLCSDEGAKFPLAIPVLESSTYVDDVLFGADKVTDIKKIRNQLNTLLNLEGFHLRKWASNYDELLNEIPISDRLDLTTVSFQEDASIKALGLSWNPSRDSFSFNFQLRNPMEVTKRSVLVISRIFDPLELIAPVVIFAKIFLQQLWIRKLEWDSPFPDDLKGWWNEYYYSLKHLPNISIPRWTNQSPKDLSIELHGFSDASSQAYAAVVYLRVLNSMD
ncbi:hypothetical protein RF55_14028 [Lasius niger]|uniref:Uncharacterized protein n=1 Tax=Lasius niger TaxID=67767 RepID=A0A0J7K963_LASNI|nr:hypothetical protein RF55_14028 [Lasius niger]